MESAGKIKLSKVISGEIDALIQDGLAHLGTFHLKKPLKYNKAKEIISEDFTLLYYYHNRLENYHLDEVIELKKEDLLMLEPESV